MREKLVRDNIPDIILKNDSVVAQTRIVIGDEYKEAIKKKILEEVEELFVDPCAEEAGDVLETLQAYVKAYDIPWKEVEEARETKAEKRGGFEEGIILTMED